MGTKTEKEEDLLDRLLGVVEIWLEETTLDEVDALIRCLGQAKG